MEGELIFHRKNVLPNRDIIEIKIWRIIKRKDKPHGHKYSLAYIRKGKRIIGYDNAESKGDHKHEGRKEIPYRFKGIETLINDFYRDVKQLMEEAYESKKN